MDVETFMECPCPFGEGEEEPQGGSQSYYGSDTGTTDNNGYLFLSTPFLPGDLVLMRVYRLSVQYSTISSENTSTTTATTLFPEFHLGADSDVNGVVDVWELPLAEKFVPSFRLHSSTDWIAPEPVEYINADATSGLWFSVINITGQKVGDYPVIDQALFTPPVSSWHPWINNPSSSWETLTFDPFDYEGQPPGKAYDDYHLRFHFGFNGNPDPNTWSPAYQAERNNNTFDHTIYAHFFKHDSKYIIQYWIFYPYNDGHNNHEGDWEHINVHLDSQNPSEANIVEIDFYFHEKVRTLTAGNFETDGGSTHPKIYVGGECIGINQPFNCSPGETTGGSYPAPGIWFDVGPLGYDEYVSGNGPYIPYIDFIDGNHNDRKGIVILPETGNINYSSSLHLRWFKAAIPWGLWEANSPEEWSQAFLNIWPGVPGDVGNDGPPGPPYNSGWNTIGDNNAFTEYTSNPCPYPCGS
ncbi:hypothetical protein MJD09_12295 [bacterium]|nr:hypothetical protein [bacterium]